MENLRRKRVSGKTALQTPVISLRKGRGERHATLILTAHLGDETYFQEVRRAVSAAGAPVFYESVRSLDSSPEHWQEPYHHFLKSLREDPRYKELFDSTVVVIMAMLLLGGYVALFDFILVNVVHFFTRIH